ncbi:HORMA domain-containing protein 2 [Pogona vitticeps]
MAMTQVWHIGPKHKTSKESALFPNKIASEQESMVLVKRLLAISVSCITYLRGLFPENSYGTRYLDDMCLKILREDKSCQGSLQIVKWIQGCFDALEKNYLRMAILAIYTNPKDPECMTEFYQFRFKYLKNGPHMDFVRTQVSSTNGASSEEVKEASILLIRKLYILMQHLGPLPNDITLTMKLFYYKDVTPNNYQPPGFKEGNDSDSLLFDGDPVNLKVGAVSTGFHVLKVRVTTESKRMGMLESNLVEENGPTEISHQGLDFDEEEEESSTEAQEQHNCEASCVKVDKKRKHKRIAESDKKHISPLHPKKTETSSKSGIGERAPSVKSCHQGWKQDFVSSQEEGSILIKKRKVSTPVDLITAVHKL